MPLISPSEISPTAKAPAPIDESHADTASVIKDIKIENGVLLSCVGQADENGVYTVPEGITFIGEGCFSYDRTLKKIIIPSTVKTIGSGAFIGCTSLKEAVIEEGVEILGSHAFWGCNALENIVLPESITEVSDYAFAYCSLLESVKLGKNVKRIGYSAFSYCTALEGIIIPATPAQTQVLIIEPKLCESSTPSRITRAAFSYFSLSKKSSKSIYLMGEI